MDTRADQRTPAGNGAPRESLIPPSSSPEDARAAFQDLVGDEDTIHRTLTITDSVRRRWQERWRSRRRPRFLLLQEWIGRVDEVSGTWFRATLTTRAEPDEIDVAEIAIEEVSLDDRHLLMPGAVFYWVMGYRDEPYGQRFGVSSIHFRRLVELSDHERESADERAARWASLLDGGDAQP